jgi:hypothetical protein
MPIHHSVWRVAKSPSRLLETTLPSEQFLEDMIVASPETLSDQWMIIGRQEDTGFGGRIDLLAIVKGPPEPAPDFKIMTDDGSQRPALDVLTSATYHRESVDDPDKMEYFVPIECAQTVPLDKAVNEIGLFGTKNIVCAPKIPKWRHKIERLKEAFRDYDKD